MRIYLFSVFIFTPMLKHFLHFILLLIANIAYCQSKDVSIKNYTQEDGLPSNEIYCVFKDSRGYMWIATDKGVVRFNGITFQKFDLPDNVVFKIKEDKDGKIWFFTFSCKLAYFWNEQIYPYKHNDSIQKHITKILIDDAYLYDNGDIYLRSTLDKDYLIKNSGEVHSYSLKKINNNESNAFDTIFLTQRKDSPEIFIQTKLNLSMYNTSKIFTIIHDNINKIIYTKKEDLTYQLSITRAVKISLKKIFLTERNQAIFINNGVLISKSFDAEILCIYHNKTTNTIFLGLRNKGFVEINEDLQILKEHRLNNNSVSSIYINDEGHVWATSLNNGLYHIIMNEKKAFKYVLLGHTYSITPFRNRLLFSNMQGIFSFSEDLKSSLFLSYYNIRNNFITNVGDSILLFNHYTKITTKLLYGFRKKDSAKIFFFRNERRPTLYKRKFLLIQEFLYFSTFDLQTYYFESNKRKFATLQDINDKQIYSSATNNEDIYKDVRQFNDTAFLIGTGRNLFLHNSNSGITKPYITNSKIFDAGVNIIELFNNNTIALGTRFNGLVVLRDTTILVHITKWQGLLSNSINYVYLDNNKLWLATNKGISAITFHSFSPIKYSIKNFSNDVGLGNEIIYQLVRFKNDIYAATSKGIFKLSNADSLLTVPLKPIPFYITTISTYLGDTSNISNISLPYSKNRVSINFNAIEFTTPKDVAYFYRITNTDSTWFSISSPQLILQDLSPGTYNIEIKAMLPKQGRTSEIKQITIMVDKPWWLKTTSLIAFALCLAGMVFLFTNWRIKKAKKTTQEKNEIATKMLKLEQNALQAQMNPHFIFNCLTGIQQLMNTNNIDEANDYLVTFSRLIRKTLENSTQEFIILQEEIDYLKQYISLEEKRLTNSLTTHFNIATNINTHATEIPNMMLQPVIENAIRHGIKPLENRAGKIEINFTVNNNSLECSVTDNGIGREASVVNKMQRINTHKSFGLDIIKQRLQGYSKSYDQNYGVEIFDLKNENQMALGTKVILTLPIKK